MNLPLDRRSDTSRAMPDTELIILTSPALRTGYIANRILPTFRVMDQAGPLPVLHTNRRLVTIKRDANGFPSRTPVQVSDKMYGCAESSHETAVPDASVKLYGTRELAENHAAENAVLKILDGREAAAAALLFSTSTFGSGLNTGIANDKRWTLDAADPAADVLAAGGAIRKRTGVPVRDQRLVISAALHEVLSKQAKMRELAKALYSAGNIVPALIPEATLAAIFGVAGIDVGGVSFDTSDPSKGDTSTSFSDAWAWDKALLYVPSTTGRIESGIGRDLIWDAGLDRGPLTTATDLEADDALAFRLDVYREERATQNVVRARAYDQLLVMNAKAGHLLTNLAA